MSTKQYGDPIAGVPAAICLALLESSLVLLDTGRVFPHPLASILALTLGLKVVHHWQARRIRRIASEQSTVHTLTHHLTTILALNVLLMADVALVGAVLRLLVRGNAVGHVVAVDAMGLPPLLWRLMAEYALCCYHHWSEQDARRLQKQQSGVAAVYHAMRLLHHAAFVSLELVQASVRPFMALALALQATALVLSLADVHKQHTGTRRLVSRLQTVQWGHHAHKTDEGDADCLICREGLQDGLDATVVKRLACNHLFHARCLSLWLPCALHCPTCRAPVH